MTDNNEPNGNGRVTTAQLYQAVMQVNDRMDEKMDKKFGILAKQIDALSRQIQDITRVEPPRLVHQVNRLERDLERETNQRQLEDDCLQVGVEANREEIVDLKIASTRGDRISAALAVVAGVISGLFGVSK